METAMGLAASWTFPVPLVDDYSPAVPRWLLIGLLAVPAWIFFGGVYVLLVVDDLECDRAGTCSGIERFTASSWPLIPLLLYVLAFAVVALFVPRQRPAAGR